MPQRPRQPPRAQHLPPSDIEEGRSARGWEGCRSRGAIPDAIRVGHDPRWQAGVQRDSPAYHRKTLNNNLEQTVRRNLRRRFFAEWSEHGPRTGRNSIVNQMLSRGPEVRGLLGTPFI